MQVFEFDPIGGHNGTVHYDLALFRALARTGLDLTWVTCDETAVPTDGYELWTPFRGIYGAAPAWRRGLRYGRGLLALLKRAHAARRRGPVVIHQQFTIIPPLELVFVNAARRLGIPCVLTPHDIVRYNETKVSRLQASLLRSYDALLALSEAGRSELAAATQGSGVPVYLTPHGHYNDTYGDDARMPQALARERLGIEQHRPVILFLGQIKKEKGLEYLIQALPTVIERVPDALLLIAGRPWHNEVDGYEALIDSLGLRSQIRTCWEYIPDQMLPVYYRAADVAALPYLRVYQSGVCLTAYAFERPVVASAAGGLVEQVVPGRTGLLVPPADAETLGVALAQIIGDRSQALEMGAYGRTWAGLAFDWNMIARRTADVYHDVWLRRNGAQQTGSHNVSKA